MIRIASHELRLLVCLLTVAACAFAGNSLESTFARMDEAAQAFTGVTADVVTVSVQAVIQDKETSTGKLFLKKNKREVRIRLDQMDPDKVIITIDPKEVDRYLAKAGTLEVYDPGKYRSLINQLLLLGFGTTSKDMQSNYTVTLGGADTIGNEPATRLQLIPKNQEVLQHMKRVDLWISDKSGMPLQQESFAPSGDYTVFTYSNVVVNPNLPDSAVKFDAPKGTKVVHPQK